MFKFRIVLVISFFLMMIFSLVFVSSEDCEFERVYFFGDKINLSSCNFSSDVVFELVDGEFNLSFNEDIIPIDDSFVVGDYIVFFDNNVSYDFSIIAFDIDLVGDDLRQGDNFSVFVNINSSIDIDDFYIDFGDGTNISGFDKGFSYSYNESGGFLIEVGVLFSGINKFFKQMVNVDVLEAFSPDIEIISPLNDFLSYTNNISFKVNFIDELGIKNCSFYMFNESGLVLSEFGENIVSGDEQNFFIDELNYGNYSWFIECYNRFNKRSQINNFSFEVKENKTESAILSQTDFLNDSLEVDVLDVIESINEFIEKQSGFGVYEREILERLDLNKKLISYKKRLLQINQDLNNNFGFNNANDGGKRIKEIEKEIEEIRNEIPGDIHVLEESEFVKNSNSIDFFDFVSDYMNLKNTDVTNRQIKKLAEANKDIQDFISLNTKAYLVELVYSDRSESFAVVVKEINVDANYNSLIEVIPKRFFDLYDFNFNIGGDFVGNYFVFNFDSLEDNELVYFIYDISDLKSIEEFDTILFDESSVDDFSLLPLTGLSFFEFGDFSYAHFFNPFLILFFVLGMVLLFFVFFGKKKFLNMDSEVMDIFKMVDKVKFALKENDLEKAREEYSRINDFYLALVDDKKLVFFKRMQSIMPLIEQEFLLTLIRLYNDKIKNDYDKDSLYDEMKNIYNRLPKRLQKRVQKHLLRKFD